MGSIGPAPLASSVTSSILVRFIPAASDLQKQTAIQSVGGVLQTVYPNELTLIQLGTDSKVTSAIQRLDASPIVVYAQPDMVIHSDAIPVIPTKPTFPYSYGLNNANNVDIDAPEAWSITTGNPSTIVAVLDSGLDLSNPDFANRIWTNPRNDAAQGYPNDIHGWNFVGNNNNVSDDNGHGTHVTSLIAAAGTNGTGVVGVDWNAQIMPIKFLDSNGNGTTDRAVSAIIFAVNHGAKVINASWGGLNSSQPLNDAIAYANAHNVVFVTAAGNDGTSNDFFPSYPASFRQPNELSVASVDSNGLLPSFSNYGGQSVDIAAPGVDILGDYPKNLSSNGLQVLSGTSMSTAYVSGVVALLAGAHPEYTATQLVQRIDATAKPLPGLAGKIITGGIVDAYYALASNPPAATGVTTAGGVPLSAGSATDAVVQATIMASDEFLSSHGGTAQGFVTGLYLDILDRSPDPGGLAYWTGLSQSGTSTRFDIASAILGSSEAEVTRVALWYQNDLGRSTSIASLKNDPGVLIWAQALNAGFSAETVEAVILSSPEYLLAHGASPPGVAAGLYQTLDGRAAEPAGQTAWANLLWGGAAPFSVVRSFQNSPESRDTKVARWYTSYLGRTTSLSTLKLDPGVQSFASALQLG